MALTEIENYLERINDLRGQVRALIAGLDANALNWRPLPASSDDATNSLAVMGAHTVGAEHFWITEVIGGRSATRDRDAEFRTEVEGAAPLLARIDEVGKETHEVFQALRPADLDGTREARGRSVAVRWGILHIVDHTALHLGHMQITYQLLSGGISQPSPEWHKRLPRE